MQATLNKVDAIAPNCHALFDSTLITIPWLGGLDFSMENYMKGIFSFLQKRNSELSYEPDDHIIRTGIIDSFGIMQLVEHLEEKYKFEFGDSDLTEENFKSIRSIAQLISDKQTSA